MIPLYDKTENSIINCFNASVKMLQKNSSDLKQFLAKLLYIAMTIFVVSVIYLIIALVYFFKVVLRPIISFHIDFEERIKSLNPLIFKDVDIDDFTQRIDALIHSAFIHLF